MLPPFIGMQAQESSLYLEPTTALTNDTAIVLLKTDGFKQIVSLQLGIRWDSEDLEYLDSHSFFPSSLPIIGHNEVHNGQLLISWIHPLAIGQSLVDGSNLLEISFRVKACPEDPLTILPTNEPLPIEMFAINDDEYVALTPELSSPDWSVLISDTFLGPDTILCLGETLELDVSDCMNCDILWSTGSLSQSLEITKSGTYGVNIITEYGCQLNDSITVLIADTPETILQPISLITPNGDEINDELCFSHLEKFEPNKLVVFNRRGQIVFQQLNYQNDWYGTHQGKPLPEGNYYYILSFSNGFESIKSFLTILR